MFVDSRRKVFLNRVIKGIQSVKSDVQNYGLINSIWLTFAKIYPYSSKNNNGLAYFFNICKHKSIIRYLENEYRDYIKCFPVTPTNQENDNTKIIWSFWWQGEENAPDIVKICFESMYRNKGDYNLIIISQENYKKYIDLPNFIIEGVNIGKIDFTHFSDLIRVYLLNRYGGIWLDSTILLLKPIPQDLSRYSFYTGKLKREKINCVSEKRWNIAFMSGNQNSMYFNFILNFYYKYWENENKLIDYFLTDYMTQIALKNFEVFKKEFDTVPINNKHIFELDLNDTYSKENLEMLSKNTFVFKNQRRRVFNSVDQNEQLTYYGYFAELYK